MSNIKKYNLQLGRNYLFSNVLFIRDQNQAYWII